MGGTEEEVNQKHHDEEIKEQKVEEKIKEKKKKDKKKEKSDENDEQVEDKSEKKEKKKNPEDKTDPAKLKIKLEKIETKIHDLVIKKEGILKSIQEAEHNATVNANKDETSLKQE